MAKRFKAAIIGGSGYGGAELVRRLLMHPDVELVRVASIDHVGEPLGAVHPNLDGATELVFEDLAPAEAARGCDVVLLALPHKVTAAKVPGADRRRREDRRHVGRLPPARRRRLREVLRREAPAPRAARHVRLRPARAQPRARSRRRSTSPRRAASRRRSSSRCCRSRARACSTARSSTSSASPARRARASRRRRGHAPPEPRRQPQDLQAARAPARPRDRRRRSRDARRQGRRAALRARCRRRSRAASSRPASSSSPPTVDADAARRALRRDATRASRSCAGPKKRLPEVVAVAGSNFAEVGFAVGPVDGRQAHRHLLRGDRQPDQGRRRPGDPEHEPRARLRRARQPRGRRELAVTAPDRRQDRRRGRRLGRGRACSPPTCAALVDGGARVAIVHGGGPQATELQKRLGLTTKQVAGRRVTDAATLDVMKMVARRQAQRRPVRGARRRRASRRSACTARPASSCAPTRRPPKVYPSAGPDPVDLGLRRRRHRLQPRAARDAVGRGLRAGDRVPRRRRRRRRLQHQRRHGRQPARRRARRRAPVPRHPTPGRPARRQRSRRRASPQLTCAEARAAIADGVVTGGMIPKLEEAMAVDRPGRRRDPHPRQARPRRPRARGPRARLRRHDARGLTPSPGAPPGAPPRRPSPTVARPSPTAARQARTTPRSAQLRSALTPSTYRFSVRASSTLVFSQREHCLSTTEGWARPSAAVCVFFTPPRARERERESGALARAR